jgi:BirA family biotin operon repressor/biotin-[acetyl-CoA-carboxylase] ligase
MFDSSRILRDTFVRDVEFHPTLPSTNTRAVDLAQLPDLTTPLLVITEQQTAGRGRGDHSWWSNDGALTFSLLIEASQFSLSPDLWPRVALATGVSVCDAVEDMLPGVPLGLKWPNDVFLAGRKVCGILTEVPANRPPVPARLVIGVGINVNNSFATAPPELQQIGIALCDAAGKKVDLTDVLVHVLHRIEANVWSLAKSDPQLPARWRELSLLTNRHVAVQQGSRRVDGLCAGIDDEGALLLDTPDGRQRMFGGTVGRSGFPA